MSTSKNIEIQQNIELGSVLCLCMAKPYSEICQLDPSLIILFKRRKMDEIMEVLSIRQKRVAKLLWGYNGAIITVEMVAHMSHMSLDQVKKIERERLI